jgi:hypothetical protein
MVFHPSLELFFDSLRDIFPDVELDSKLPAELYLLSRSSCSIAAQGQSHRTIANLCPMR